MNLLRFDGPTNMAQDEELLNRAELGNAGWRVYRWDGPWVSLGRFQKPEQALLQPERVPWVIRPTGGLAVLHGHDVTVGLAAPLEGLWEENGSLESLEEFGGSDREGLTKPSNRSLRTVYRLAISPILEALRACGAPALLGEEFGKPPRLFDEVKREWGLGGEGSGSKGDLLPPAPSSLKGGGGVSSDCFAAVSPNDIVDSRTGLKICGCALRVTRKAVLVQASIPAGQPLIDPATLFALPAQIEPIPWDADAFPEALSLAFKVHLHSKALV